MKTPRSKLRGIRRKKALNLLEASFGESHPKRFNVEVIPTIDIHVLIPGRPDIGKITLIDRISLAFELFDNFRHVDGVP
jgi:hypothetical protein